MAKTIMQLLSIKHTQNLPAMEVFSDELLTTSQRAYGTTINTKTRALPCACSNVRLYTTRRMRRICDGVILDIAYCSKNTSPTIQHR